MTIVLTIHVIRYVYAVTLITRGVSVIVQQTEHCVDLQ